MIAIYIDADACPVKQEIYRVAERHVLKGTALKVFVVSNSPIAVPRDMGDLIERVVVGAGVIAPNGKPFTEESIGMTLATRNLMDSLRSAGEITSGPKPFAPRDRSAFLSALAQAIVRLRRAGFG